MSRSTVEIEPAAAAPERSPRPRFDIQALRAVAVTLVVLYHLNIPLFAGGFIGVDVFFVISGYLITGHLARELEATGRIGFLNFYLARIRRLLPAAGVVLVFIAVVTPLALPVTRWSTTAEDLLGSVLNVENWVLAKRSVDYLAQGTAPSVVQHFWSLSVEEQFYLIWPALLLIGVAACGGLLRPRGVGKSAVRRGLVACCAVVVTISFAVGVAYSAQSPDRAYFVTFTRIWELAAGGLIWTIFNPLRGQSTIRCSLDASARNSIAVAGLVIICLAAVFVPPSASFPGVLALIPVAGAALILAAGAGGGGDEAESKTRTRIRQLGDVSYSLYLWHWPVIVIIHARLGDGVPQSLLAVGLSLAAAAMSYRYVESLRYRAWFKRSRKAPLLLVITSIAMVAALALGLLQLTDRRVSTANEQLRAFESTGRVISGGTAASRQEQEGENVVPAPVVAGSDWSACDTAPVDSSVLVRCDAVAKGGRKVIVVVGDSHAKQWIPAFESIAKTRDWGVVAFIHDSCPLAAGPLRRSSELRSAGQPYTACEDWNRQVAVAISRMTNIALLVTSAYANDVFVPHDAGNSTQAIARAYADGIRPFLTRGYPVVQIKDTPAPGIDVPDCVALHPSALNVCSVPLKRAVTPNTEAATAAHRMLNEQTVLLDLTNEVCRDAICDPVQEGVLVFRDTNHLTATYSRSLAPVIEREIYGRLK